MLVVTANWSVGDGTLHGASLRGSVESFLRNLRRAAWRSGFRTDGRYRPVQAIHIVLAGDTFDGLASLGWQGGVRPWHNGDRARAVAERIASSALSQGRRLFAALGRLRRDGLDVPDADGRGRPRPGTMRRAPVDIAVLVGDRDRVLEAAWFAALAERHGVAIGTEQASDMLVIRHGEECDPICGLPGVPRRNRSPTLAESLVVDLIGNFARRLHDEVTPPVATAGLVRRVATASPLDAPRHVASWLTAGESVRSTAGALAERGTSLPEQDATIADGGNAPRFHRSTTWKKVMDGDSHDPMASIVREAWKQSTDHWHSQARAMPPDVAVEHDVVDAVAAWMEAAARDTSGHGLRPDPAIEQLAPRIAEPAAGSRSLVLGHPPSDAVESRTDGRATCICLGSRRHAGHAFGVYDAAPATVVFPDADATSAEWLSDGVHVGGGGQPATCVARVGIPCDEPGIVDAA